METLNLYHLPRVEVGTVKFFLVWFGKVNIQRLALINERTAVGGHFDDSLLRDFPNSLVQTLYLVRNAINLLLIHMSPKQFHKSILFARHSVCY